MTWYMDHFYRRIEVWKDTEQTAPPCKQRSVKHKYDPDFQMEVKYGTTSVHVVNQDLLDAGGRSTTPSC